MPKSYYQRYGTNPPRRGGNLNHKPADAVATPAEREPFTASARRRQSNKLKGLPVWNGACPGGY